MKRINKILYTGVLTLMIAALNPSCSEDFLKEEMVSNLTTAYFDTEEGVDALEVALYQSLRFFFSEEHAYTMSNYGTDEFQVGGGTDYRYMNDYSSTMSAVDPKPLFSGLSDWWDAIYGNINTANMLIVKAPLVLAEGDKQNTYRGEALFMRGFLYFRLVNQYGGVPLKLVPSETVEYEFARATKAEVFSQVITDLTEAAQLLPATTTGGRVSKATAWHFLAKACLFRASEKNADITESTDLDKAIEFGLKVINQDEGTDRALANNYYDFWNYFEEGPDGPSERSSEILLAAQYSNNSEKFDRLCNRTHLYYLPRYENNITGMTRVIQYGRPYQRLRPTEYAYDVFDRVNDSRFWKTFRTLYVSTKAANGTDILGVSHPYVVGQTPCIKIIINDKDDARFTQLHASSTYPNYWLRNYINNSGQKATNLSVTQFAGIDKYMDPHRTGNQNDINGVRDGYLARVGETYLTVAEAYGRKGSYAQAVQYINALRRRAGYSQGENRNPNANGSNPYFVGGTYYETTGLPVGTVAETKSNMEITESAFTAASDAGIPYSVFGATSKEEKFIHFILNERSRELLGEFLRWEDLTRTETLYDMYLYSRNNCGGCGLYNPKDGLWWRDADFVPPYREPNGEDCYWSRGNGWVIAAMVRVLEQNPPDKKQRKEYINMLKSMSKALLKVQRDDGFWNVSLHDPDHFGGPETSGTAFFIYGIAWGINNGYLGKAKYLPVVLKAWDAMCQKVLHTNGSLGFVQGTGKEPSSGQPVTYDSKPDFEDYGLGAFLLAGSEIYRLSNQKRIR